ncbi:B12-dependent methionine synthase [Escherichia coli]|nr:B12-dependent methionine synthase [Escherichia coli]
MSVVRKVYWGYAPNENLSNEELIREKLPGHPSGTGYPACRNIRKKPPSGSCWKWKNTLA